MESIAERIGKDRVAMVMDDFYDHVRQHPTLSVPFGIVHDWETHKAHIGHFWWVSLGGKPYGERAYDVAAKHNAAGFTPALLVDWLALFEETLHRQLPDELAAPWMERARNIGKSLNLLYEFHHGLRPRHPDDAEAHR